MSYGSGALAQLTNSLTTFIPPAAWIGGTRGAVVLEEPLFAPRSIRVVTGQPAAPPTVEVRTFEQEGAGHVPMFRRRVRPSCAATSSVPSTRVSETVAVLRSIEWVRDALAESRKTRV